MFVKKVSDKIDKSIAIISNRDNLEFLKEIEDQSVNLIITSPPYNIKREYEKSLTHSEYLIAQEKVIFECIRILHDTGSICWQIGTYANRKEKIPLDIILYPLFKKYGLYLKNRIVWHFGHGLHAKNSFSGRYETILWFTKSPSDYVFNLDPVRVPQKYPKKKYYDGDKKGLYSCNPLGKNPSDVWIIPNVKNNHVEKTVHPCQFPVGLVERLVLSLSNPNDKVLDPYLGSGTTVIAAIKNGRQGIGCEIIQKYYDISIDRVNTFFLGQLKTRPMNKPVLRT